MTKPRIVHAHTKTTIKSVAEYISWQIEICGKKQLEIAEECGFDKANMITMIKQGKSKLPMNKIGPMAKSLGIDPVNLLKMCLQEYLPDTWEAIQRIVNQPIITLNEWEFVETIREAGVINPRITPDAKTKIIDIVKTLKPEGEV